jgi:hypothetical protein
VSTSAFPCSSDFVGKYLSLPDAYDGEVLVYDEPRDYVLNKEPDPIDISVITPFGIERPVEVSGGGIPYYRTDRRYAVY